MYRYISSNTAIANIAKSKPVSNLKWHRVVLKISGAAFVGDCQSTDPKVEVLSIILIATPSNLFYVSMVHVHE